jgi:hypothetical protein
MNIEPMDKLMQKIADWAKTNPIKVLFSEKMLVSAV